MANLTKMSLEEIVSIVIGILAFIIVGYFAFKHLGVGYGDISAFSP